MQARAVLSRSGLLDGEVQGAWPGCLVLWSECGLGDVGLWPWQLLSVSVSVLGTACLASLEGAFVSRHVEEVIPLLA